MSPQDCVHEDVLEELVDTSGVLDKPWTSTEVDLNSAAKVAATITLTGWTNRYSMTVSGGHRNPMIA